MTTSLPPTMLQVDASATNVAKAGACPPWRQRLTGHAAAAVVLGLFYLALLASVHDKSATFDEPGHALAGCTYWKKGDFRLDPENGNLPQRWFGLALLTAKQSLPQPDAPGWSNADSWTLGDTWLNRSGNDVTFWLPAAVSVAA